LGETIYTHDAEYRKRSCVYKVRKYINYTNFKIHQGAELSIVKSNGFDIQNNNITFRPINNQLAISVGISG
jgi:hypothetical protein